MSELKPLSDLKFEVPPVPSADLGKAGEIVWLPVAQLFIDDAYQRTIDLSGRRNIRRMIEKFRWHLFDPVVVSPRGRNRYAVIDGQHRAVAAKLHGGIAKVPCWVLKCSAEEEAESFAVINGMITRVTTQALFKARIAAGDRDARAAARAAKEAGVTLLAYPVAAAAIKTGETCAVGTVEECVKKYGGDVVTPALRLIVETGGGNRGLLRAQMIEALCDAVRMHPKWAARFEDMKAALDTAQLSKLWQQGAVDAAAQRTGLRGVLTKLIEGALSAALGDGGKVAAKTKAEIARETAQAEGRARQQKVEAARAGNTLAPKAPVKGRMDAASVADAVAAFKAKGGAVRTFESGATADSLRIIEYLQRKGVPAMWRSGRYYYRNKEVKWAKIVALADKEREKEGKAPISKSAKAA